MKSYSAYKRIISWVLLIVIFVLNTFNSYAKNPDFVFIDDEENIEINNYDDTIDMNINLSIDNEIVSIESELNVYRFYDAATPSNATKSVASPSNFDTEIYVAIDDLDDILYKYNFDSNKYNGEQIFTYVNDDIVIPIIPIKKDNDWYLPVKEEYNLFYSPNTEIKTECKFDNIISDNTFYSIHSDDLFTDGKRESDIFYVLTGEGTTLSPVNTNLIMPLSFNENSYDNTYICTSEDGKTIKENTDRYGNTVFIINNILQPYYIQRVDISKIIIENNVENNYLYKMTINEGIIKSSTFVLDGTDYSKYDWMTENDEKINLSDYIDTVIEDPIILYSNGNTLKNPETKGNIDFYVCVNGIWIRSNLDVDVEYIDGGYWLSAAILESIYGNYGFTADQMIDGSTLFPHSDKNDGEENSIWADRAAKNGFSPILGTSPDCEVYYNPNYTFTNGSIDQYERSWFQWVETDDFANFTKANSHCEISIEDPYQKLNNEIPTLYGLNGSQRIIQLPAYDKYGEKINYTISPSNNVTISEIQNDYRNIIINNVSSNYIITVSELSEGEYAIFYDINNLDHTPHTGLKPTIKDNDTYVEIFDINTGEEYYTVESPTRTAYSYEDGKYLYRVKFVGWRIKETGKLIEAGKLYTKDEITSLLTNYGSLHLNGEWVEGENPTSVHFYLNLSCQILNYDGSISTTPSNQYTDAVYVSEISENGVEIANKGQAAWETAGGVYGNDEYIVLQGATDGSAFEIDGQLRNLINEPYTEISGYSFKLDSFPSDDEVFREVRNMVNNGTVITMEDEYGNEKTLTADELTAEKFAIRWYVLKYSTSDAWHVDGILVAKTGSMVIQKTFTGEIDVVNEVKNNFSISVINKNDGNDNRTLTLNNIDSENNIGYDEYDKDTDTYTWILPVTQTGLYTIRENNYEYESNDIKTTANYSIKNSLEHNTNLIPYPENGIENIKGEVHADDEDYSAYQTISLKNSYTSSGTLTINKIDKETGNGIKDVSFVIENIENDDYTLYEKEDGFYIFINDESVPDGYNKVTPVNGSYIVKTNDVGSIYLSLETGKYRLTEKTPVGYIGADYIDIEMSNENGNIVFKSTAFKDGIDVSNEYLENDLDNNILNISNVSEKFDITVIKKWNEDNYSEEVVLDLYRNGIPIYNENGKLYQITLNGNDDNWSHTIKDLPIYVDGKLAVYSLRESRIGDYYYDPAADKDGYKDYVVIYEEPIYLFSDGSISDSPIKENNFAKELKLQVNNSLLNGEVTFTKTDENGNGLIGAVFYIYKRVLNEETGEYEDQIVSTGTSDINGTVSISLIPGEYYIMKENQAPDGYITSSEEYGFVVNGNGTTIMTSDGKDTNNKIINYEDNVSITIKKASMDETELLDNAEFDLYKYNDSTGNYEKINKDPLITNNGIINSGKLEIGNYYIIETKAPIGYIKNDTPIYFAFTGPLHLTNENGNEIENETKFSDRNYKIEKDGTTYIITIKNEIENTVNLPETGGNVIYLQMTGLLLMISIIIKKRKGISDRIF